MNFFLGMIEKYILNTNFSQSTIRGLPSCYQIMFQQSKLKRGLKKDHRNWTQIDEMKKLTKTPNLVISSTGCYAWKKIGRNGKLLLSFYLMGSIWNKKGKRVELFKWVKKKQQLWQEKKLAWKTTKRYLDRSY